MIVNYSFKFHKREIITSNLESINEVINDVVLDDFNEYINITLKHYVYKNNKKIIKSELSYYGERGNLYGFIIDRKNIPHIVKTYDIFFEKLLEIYNERIKQFLLDIEKRNTELRILDLI